MIKLERILEQVVAEMEEEHDTLHTSIWWLKKLKKDRAIEKYTREVRYQMLESYREPNSLDTELESIDKLIDQAIDDALNDIDFDENNRKVTELIHKHHQLMMESVGLDHV